MLEDFSLLFQWINHAYMQYVHAILSMSGLVDEMPLTNAIRSHTIENYDVSTIILRYIHQKHFLVYISLKQPKSPKAIKHYFFRSLFHLATLWSLETLNFYHYLPMHKFVTESRLPNHLSSPQFRLRLFTGHDYDFY